MWWIRASGESASAGRDRVLTLSLEEYVSEKRKATFWKVPRGRSFSPLRRAAGAKLHQAPCPIAHSAVRWTGAKRISLSALAILLRHRSPLSWREQRNPATANWSQRKACRFGGPDRIGCDIRNQEPYRAKSIVSERLKRRLDGEGNDFPVGHMAGTPPLAAVREPGAGEALRDGGRTSRTPEAR